MYLLYDCINFFEKYLEKYKTNFLYASALGNPLIRSFCLAANRLDIKTFGFTHGNYIITRCRNSRRSWRYY